MDPQVTNLLIYLAIGAIAGWLGSNLVRGAGLGLVGNIIAGIVGSVVGTGLHADRSHCYC